MSSESMERKKAHYLRDIIREEELMKYASKAGVTSFQKSVVKTYMKGINESQLAAKYDVKESIMKEYEDVKIQKIDLFDSEQCNKCFYFENRLLAQLLINSMRTPKHEAFMYNNLTGKLFYHDPSWRHKDKLTGKVNFVRFLEIVIDPGMYLNLEHKTFKRYDRESNGLYVIDSKTGEFRKKLKTDTNVITYKEGSLPHNHFRVDNFDIYDFVEDKHRGARNQVEGLMYSDIDNIHAILLTREKTLPNISALMNTLMETDAKERVSKKLLLEAIDDFEKDNIDSRECISEWKNKVAAETEMITKKAMKKILNMRTGIASKFNRFLHEKYGVWIDGELRKGEFEATYQIGNLLNIKYEYNEKDYLDGRTFVYYVGAKSKRLAYPNACCMRKVISLGEELEYEEVLPLMAVEFVRNSQYTVLPFPFKYLREYMEQC